MAIQIVFEDGAGVVHNEAYARAGKIIIENPVDGNPSLSADVCIYADEDRRRAGKSPVWGPQGFTFPLDSVAGATVATAYQLLKALDEYKDGKDV
jgi:hypothetical protein